MTSKTSRCICKILVSFLCLFSFFSADIIVNAEETDNNQSMKRILIDPGHGGVDGGAVSKKGTIEKDVTLKIGLKLKDALSINGYKVIMTRETDKGLYSEGKKTIRQKKIEDLNNRCKLKTDSKCDMFISVHLNMFTQSKYKGAQVWYSNNEESKKLASIVMKNFKTKIDKTNTRVEKCANNDFKILRCNDEVPSIIIECGFLSNPDEEKLLLNDQYQEKVVNAIVDSIEEYFKN